MWGIRVSCLSCRICTQGWKRKSIACTRSSRISRRHVKRLPSLRRNSRTWTQLYRRFELAILFCASSSTAYHRLPLRPRAIMKTMFRFFHRNSLITNAWLRPCDRKHSVLQHWRKSMLICGFYSCMSLLFLACSHLLQHKQTSRDRGTWRRLVDTKQATEELICYQTAGRSAEAPGGTTPGAQGLSLIGLLSAHVLSPHVLKWL